MKTHCIAYRVLCPISLLFVLLLSCCTPRKTATTLDNPAVAVPIFDADTAYAGVAAQVAYGPRVPGSPAHRACGDWLVAELCRYGATVTEQNVDLKAYTGDVLPSRNIIGSFLPEARKRVLLCSHWDSRPWADADPDVANRRTPILGANDGASGVGVLLEIARQLGQHPAAIGVDIVFFDSEDYGVHQEDTEDSEGSWCLGSQYWARQACRNGYMARYGILLDMVGAPNARFHKEGMSCHYASNIVDKVWRAAHAIGFGEYFPLTDGSFTTDDHIPVSETAKVPCIDIIPYDEEYGFGKYWHTLRDDMSWIDPATLHAVGQTVLHVVYNEK